MKLKKNQIVSSGGKDFRILDLLGAGGQGEVYLAECEGQKYALKVYIDDPHPDFCYRKVAEQGYPYAQYELGKRMHDEEGGLLWLHLSAKQGFWLAMKELSDRLRLSDPKASERWLKRYYRNKDKHDAWRWHGKKYMREYMREQQPEMIDGEVVILI